MQFDSPYLINTTIVTGSFEITGTINPGDNAQYDLGTSAKAWKTVYSTNLSGSLTKLASGADYLVAGTGITLSTGSSGQITITSTVAGSSLIGGSNTQVQFNDNSNFAGNSGLTYNKTTGALTGTYIVASTGFSGSLTKLASGADYLVAGTGIQLTTGSSGNITIASTAVTSPAGSTTQVQFNNAGSFGASSNFTFNSSQNLLQVSNISGTLTGSNISVGQVVVAGSSGVLSGTNNLYWDNTNARLGISTSSPNYKLTIGGTGNVFGVDNGTVFSSKNVAGTYENYLWPRWTDDITYFNYGAAGWNIRNNTSTSVMFMTNGGNIGIGTTNPLFSLQFGNNISTSTATPQTINMGGTYSSTAGANAKLKLWYDGTNTYGFGVSTAQLDYIANTGAAHVWYLASTEISRINSSGMSVTGSLQPGVDNTYAVGTSSKRWSNIVSTSLSGSLTKLSDGITNYIQAGSNITVTTGSNGVITITGTSSGTVTGTGTSGLVARWNGTTSLGTGVIYDDGTNVGIGASPGGNKLSVNGSMSVTGSLLPGLDVTYNLGSSTNRWANIFTGDLHLKNERGDWTIIEEEDCLTMRNNKTGKRYKINMTPMPELDEPLGSFSSGPKRVS